MLTQDTIAIRLVRVQRSKPLKEGRSSTGSGSVGESPESVSDTIEQSPTGRGSEPVANSDTIEGGRGGSIGGELEREALENNDTIKTIFQQRSLVVET